MYTPSSKRETSMPDISSLMLSEMLWTVVGVSGAFIFYSRFYVQWYVSERQGKSVVPVGFWYMSGVGTLMLLPYAIFSHSPIGALSQCFNIVVYARNLVHIWRRNEKLTKCTDRLIHILIVLIAFVAITAALSVWIHEYKITKTDPLSTPEQTWLWLGIGLLGQILFTSRLLLQWIVTEKKRQSTIPPAFWHLSFFAALLQSASFIQRHEWIFAVGVAATIIIYLRNIMLLSLEKKKRMLAL